MVTMTDLLTRGTGTDDESSSRPAVTAVTAAAAAAVAAAVGLVACIGVAVMGWAAGGRGGVVAAVRAGADAWLLGHGAGLHAAGVTITVVPLGLLLIVAGIVWMAARWVAATAAPKDRRGIALAAATLAGCYAAMATATAVLAGTEQVSASPVRALVGSLLVAGIAGGAGLARGTGVLAAAVAGRHATVRAVLTGASAVVVVLVGAGALLTTGSLLADFADAATVAQAVDAGVVGGSVFTALQVLLLPNAALLAVSYLIGPGFVLGTDTIVAPTGVSLGEVPALPLLAALPSDGPAPWWAIGLVGVPVLAGAVGAVVALRAPEVSSLDVAVLRGGLAGLVGGGAAGLLTALGGGAAGPGRMADIGALAWECAGVAAVAAALGGAAVGLLHRRWISSRRVRSPRRPRLRGRQQPPGADQGMQ